MTFYAIAPRPANERQRQAALIDAGVADKRPAGIDALVRLSADLFDAGMGIATVVTARKMVVLAGHGYAWGDLDRDVSFCSHVVARPEAVTCVLDAAEDVRFAGNPLVRGGPAIRFYIGAPLIAPCGSALGALCAIDTRPRTVVTTEQQSVLTGLAAQVTAELLRR